MFGFESWTDDSHGNELLYPALSNEAWSEQAYPFFIYFFYKKINIKYCFLQK